MLVAISNRNAGYRELLLGNGYLEFSMGTPQSLPHRERKGPATGALALD